MIIELRNCSLEIGYIGTRDQIALQELMTKWPNVCEEAGKIIGKLANTIQESAIQVANFFKTEECQKMIKLMGVRI
jgi:hypothetical protein